MNFRYGSPTPEDPACTGQWHGTIRAYEYHGCRCPTAAERVRRRWRDRSRSLSSPCSRAPSRHGRGVDKVAVDRACAGEPVGRVLTDDEFTLAVARLSGRHLSALEIAERLGVHPRTVQRHRRRVREHVGQVA